MITIHTHRVRGGDRHSRHFFLEGESIRLEAKEDEDGRAVDYTARIVRSRELGLGYGRGIYGFDRLVQLPVDAEDGDTLYLFETNDSHYHTHYHFERNPEQPGEAVRRYRLVGDHLEEESS